MAAVAPYAHTDRSPFSSPALEARSFVDLEPRTVQGSLRRVEAKEFVFLEGDPISHLYRVESGAVALYKVLADGRRQVLGFAYPGDLIGLGAEGEHVMNAQAVKPTRLRCLPVSALNQSLARDPALGMKLYEALAKELAATRDLVLTTGQRSAMERVAGFLLALSRRNRRNGQDPKVFDLPMTRADIGDFLGLTIETVSRTLTKLKTLKVIGLPQTHSVHILDLDRLEAMAEGAGRY
ncbi:MAG TPA: helix-turn-helix domain-containing protein [Hyphomicrobiaceae bacterium]|nr:helix-turn-helix domain-containing protein [Hyphomicrobiaceae bacterium]